MADPARARRLADRIKVVVSETLRTRVKDPRVGFVTVTDVRVTNDLQHATVFYTVLEEPEAAGSTATALESARGLLRSEIGRQTGVRLTPTVEFVPDAVPEAASRIDHLIEEVRRRDAEMAETAAGASFAGEEDPYRRPVDTGGGAENGRDSARDERPRTSTAADRPDPLGPSEQIDDPIDPEPPAPPRPGSSNPHSGV
jgi:ribosome-binding factor A